MLIQITYFKIPQFGERIQQGHPTSAISMHSSSHRSETNGSLPWPPSRMDKVNPFKRGNDQSIFFLILQKIILYTTVERLS